MTHTWAFVEKLQAHGWTSPEPGHVEFTNGHDVTTHASGYIEDDGTAVLTVTVAAPGARMQMYGVILPERVDEMLGRLADVAVTLTTVKDRKGFKALGAEGADVERVKSSGVFETL